MNREETKRAAEVMMHYANGGEVQLEKGDGGWEDVEEPNFAWDCCHYRIKPHPVEVTAWAVINAAGDDYTVHATRHDACNRLASLCCKSGFNIVELKGTYTCDT